MNNDLRLKRIEETVSIKKQDTFIFYTYTKGTHSDSKGNVYSDEELQAKINELESDPDIDWKVIHFKCRQGNNELV